MYKKDYYIITKRAFNLKEKTNSKYVYTHPVRQPQNMQNKIHHKSGSFNTLLPIESKVF